MKMQAVPWRRLQALRWGRFPHWPRGSEAAVPGSQLLAPPPWAVSQGLAGAVSSSCLAVPSAVQGGGITGVQHICKLSFLVGCKNLLPAGSEIQAPGPCLVLTWPLLRAQSESDSLTPIALHPGAK